MTVFCKGGKTRSIQLPGSAWKLLALRPKRQDQRSDVRLPEKAGQGSGRLGEAQVWRIVRNAAPRFNLVQATLGHSSIATTGKYLHARPKRAPAAFWPFDLLAAFVVCSAVRNTRGRS